MSVLFPFSHGIEPNRLAKATADISVIRAKNYRLDNN